MTPEQLRHARVLLTRPDPTRPDPTRPDATVTSIAWLLGVSRSTIYKYVPEPTTALRRQADG
ncbi:hypothetical protein [Streptosporangium sp. NBC_01756]|uniref:hypothetical protein n=1 Tax=Streptosporangium sp. NBC_01756 TaxID=2975950 RepID=UPI002DD8E770|nr:hypothetical protein [Streptosporangium sp. NBC_01756]WSC88546.1 hypothetical protein OIE48_10260 [Streptosporangium sp. NBC_01756]